MVSDLTLAIITVRMGRTIRKHDIGCSSWVFFDSRYPLVRVQPVVVLPVGSARCQIVFTADVLCLLVLNRLQLGTVGDTVTKSTAVGTADFSCEHTNIRSVHRTPQWRRSVVKYGGGGPARVS